MIFIGVTGGIGSGKSTICSLFQKKGVPVFFADECAREISENSGLDEIVQAFGIDVVDEKKKLKRKVLAEIVFQDTDALQKLNSIIHPKVFEAYNVWKQGNFGPAKFGLVEAALMFESGMFEMVDYVLAVVADDAVKIQRVVDRDRSTDEQVKARMKNQISAEELLELSDFQILNNGTVDDLTTKVNFFHMLFSTLQPPKEVL